uniref:Ig-like domain-containing protein n=1 Tax=Suricata suricatta TaxID=37032 RepID=A0A673UGZ2_SURSU
MPLLWSLLCLLAAPLGVLSQLTLRESGPGLVKPSQTLSLTCVVSGGSVTSSYYWNRIHQRPGRALEWMGYWTVSTSYNPAFQGRITITADTSKNQFSLQLSSVTTEDTAVAELRDLWGRDPCVHTASSLAASTKAPSVFPLDPRCRTTCSSTVALACLVSSYFPERVTVTWNSGALTSGVHTFPSVLQASGLYSLSSMVTVPSSKWYSESKTFTCNVAHLPSNTKVNKICKRVSTGHRPVDKTRTPNPCDECPKCPGESAGHHPAPQGDGRHPVGGPSVFVFPPKPKDTLSISRTPEVTCMVVDLSQDDPEVQITWFMDNVEMHTAKTRPSEEQFNSTYRVVSVLPILHQDWLKGKEFKCKVNNKALPSPIERTISKQPLKPQVYVLPPPPEELSKSKVSLTCLVQGFYPEDIAIEWEANGQQEPENNYRTTPAILDRDGTYFLYSRLPVDKSSWQNGYSYTCSVSHEALHSRHTQKSLSYSPGK